MNDPRTDPLIGRVLDGRYRIRSKIARGGMATVYLATDTRLERRVAVKVMHAHLAEDDAFTHRFVQEALSSARLAHPNVVSVFDQGRDGNAAYLVMEYLPGITLRDLLQEQGRLSTEQTIDIMESVLAGLTAAHASGIIHRDLKPENVMLADDGRVKIGDFGLSRAATANTATGTALLGTIAYLSPELVTRGLADTRSDIYALGIMMYEMLVGEQPFKGDQPVQIAYQHANGSVPPPSAQNPRIPAELDELVLWATARQPADRPRDAAELREHLLHAHRALATSLPRDAQPARNDATTKVIPGTVAGEVGAAPPASEDATAVIADVTPSRHPAHAAPQRPTPPATASAAPASALALAGASRRRGRGWVWFLVVLVLTAAAAGAGFVFAGQANLTTIPEIAAGTSVADATAVLVDAGFEVSAEPLTEHSVDVPVDLVIRSEPGSGTALPRGDTVQLVVSLGPRIVVVPEVIGSTETEARTALTDFAVGQESLRIYDEAVAADAVMQLLTAEGADLPAGTEVAEATPVTLVVSAGPLPQVSGITVDEAVAQLGALGLSVGRTDVLEFSDTIPAGAVIRVASPDGAAVRVGGTVDLIVSQGPELFDIPDVVGMSWAEAKPLLQQAAGTFSLSYNAVADVLPEAFTVTAINPTQDQAVPRGTVLQINFFT